MLKKMRFKGYTMEEGIFAKGRNEDELTPEEDEKIDQAYYDEDKLNRLAVKANRYTKHVIKNLILVQEGIIEMLKYLENPDVDKDDFKIYVDDAGVKMAEELFHIAVHIQGITPLLAEKQFCNTMGINTRRGTFYPDSKT
jgi:hypothetical protein